VNFFITLKQKWELEKKKKHMSPGEPGGSKIFYFFLQSGIRAGDAHRPFHKARLPWKLGRVGGTR
jgi:hypothetical protein